MLRMGAASRDAYNAVKVQQLPIPRKPNTDMPTLPHDPTGLDDKDLMALYAELVAWSDYLSVQVACAASDEKSAVSRLEVLEAKFLVVETSQGNKVTAARSAMKSDQDVVTAKSEVADLGAYRRLVEALYNSLERDTTLLSRELTRRTSAFRREGQLPA